MRCSTVRLLSLALAILPVAPLCAQEDEAESYEVLLQSGQRKLLRGELLAAEAKFEELYEWLLEDGAEPDDRYLVAAEVGIQTIELRRGKYERAFKSLSKLAEDVRAQRNVTFLLAESRWRVGRYDEAIALLEKRVEQAADDLQARHLLAEACVLDGQRTRARKLWKQNADADVPEDALQLAFQGRSLYRLGGRPNYEVASQRFVDSMAKAPERPEARTTYGELKFRAYGEAANFASGEKDLKKVLDQNGDNEEALLAMYRVRKANMALDAGKTEKFLSRVLDRNPRCVEALMLRAANVLDDRRFQVAAELLDDVLAIDPNHRVTLCHRAAAAYLLGDDEGYESFRKRALAGDGGWPECDQIIGDHIAAMYRFADAVPFFEAALALDATHVPSLHGIARSLIYSGEGERAKELLMRAAQLEKGMNDPWRHNALAVQALLEEEYDVVEHGDFRMALHKDDSEVLRAYLLPIHLEAVDVLGKKYGWTPDEKTTVEVFHTWDDFSVRTIGFRGFTALGACFGRLITLVSPVDNDLRRNDFMWEATAWHEYTHVLTLGVSNNRVPRWLTEGFSVYEERARDTSWERGMERELFDAFHNQDIPPVRLLNRLFRGPRILFGYYQGGLIVELISKKYGFDKALELLRGYGDDLGIEATFQRALGMSSRAFDEELLDYVENTLLRGMKLVPRFDNKALQRLFAKVRRDKDDIQARIDLCWASLQRDNPVDAGRFLAEVLRREPDNAQAHLVRAEMLRRRKQNDQALEFWKRGFAGGANDFDSRIRYGDVLLEAGDVDGAIDQYQRAKACWPRCTEQESAPELRLAKVYRDRGDRTQAQMEMKSYCRRTARAFAPRWTLAEFEREAGNRSEELRFLVECNRIDPFYRELHVRLGEVYEAQGKQAQAAREYEVAAAVLPQADRAYLPRDKQAPEADSPEEREARGALWVRAAKLRHKLGDAVKRDELIARAQKDAPGTEAASEARDLEQEWRGR